MAFRLAGQVQNPEVGGITGLLRSIANPARKTAGQAFDALSRSGNFFRDIGARLAGRQSSGQAYDPADNPFLNEQERQVLNSGAGNYALQSLKNTAGIASYVVPFGRGANIATRAVIPGATAGGLSGFSNDEDIGGIAKSAAFGGVTAGITDKVLRGLLGGKTGAAIEETGTNLRKSIVNPQARDPLRADAPTVENEIFQNAQEFRLKGSGKQQRLQIDKLYKQAKDTIASELKNDTPILKDQIINDVGADVIQNGVGFDMNNSAHQSLLTKELNKLASSSKSQEVVLKNLFDARTRISTELYQAKSDDARTVLSALVKSLDKKIADVSPEIAKQTTIQHKLHTLASGATKKALEKQGFGVTIPVLGSRVQLSPEISQNLQDLVGRGMQKVGKVLSSPLISEDLASTLTGAVPRVATNLPDTVSSSTPTIPSPMDTVPSASAAPQTDDLTQLLQLGVLSGDLTSSDVTALQALGLVPKEGTAMQAKGQAQLNQAAPAISRIAQVALEAPSGLEGSLRANVGRIPGVEGGPAEYLAQDTEGLATLLAKAFAAEVGVATDRDISRWKAILPQPGDTLGERKRKLREMADQVITSSQANGYQVPQEIYQVLQQVQ